MPIDGLSFFNNELYKVSTPSEMKDQAEQFAKTEAETVIKKPEENEKTKADVSDNKEESKDLEGRDTSDSEDEEICEDDLECFQTEYGKNKYKVKFNSETDLVELIDKMTGKVVQTLSYNDLKELIKKNKKSSGMLVDKEG